MILGGQPVRCENVMRTDSHRALGSPNFRRWIAGTSVSNLGTWLQRTAQEWLVLTELTQHDAAAVGWVVTLQFGPQLLLLPWVGLASDRYDRRSLLLVTQAATGVLALALGSLTIMGVVELWQVYVFALMFGCVSALDAPARQTFVFELVGDRRLDNAIALNSTSFNLSRLVGPALAGFCIAHLGAGWGFVANGVSFLAVLLVLLSLPRGELHVMERHHAPGGIWEGVRCVIGSDEMRVTLAIVALIGMFGLNVGVLIGAMAVRIFDMDASGYGVLSSMFAVGSVAGALAASMRKAPRFTLLPGGALVLAIGFLIAAMAESTWVFALALIVIGAAALTVLNNSNSLMQLSVAASLRGRVMAVRLAVSLGGCALGAPLVGWIANEWGPRAALVAAAVGGLSAAGLGFRHVRRSQTAPAPPAV